MDAISAYPEPLRTNSMYGKGVTELQHCKIWYNGTKYETTDIPEQIGPWVGRMLSILQPNSTTASLQIEIYRL